MIAHVTLTVLFFAPCIERAMSRSSRFFILPLQIPHLPLSHYRIITILRNYLLLSKRLCSVEGQRSQEHRKAAGFVCSCDAVFSQREAGFSQFVSQIFRRPDFDEALCRLG